MGDQVPQLVKFSDRSRSYICSGKPIKKEGTSVVVSRDANRPPFSSLLVAGPESLVP